MLSLFSRLPRTLISSSILPLILVASSLDITGFALVLNRRWACAEGEEVDGVGRLDVIAAAIQMKYGIGEGNLLNGISYLPSRPRTWT